MQEKSRKAIAITTRWYAGRVRESKQRDSGGASTLKAGGEESFMHFKASRRFHVCSTFWGFIGVIGGVPRQAGLKRI